ncbi:MAG: hypothetical protein HXX10_16730 [Rhodoplanes sp.]|uniref:hypothetical protein n=1 Tax=Rhodoplanes sp. TaxID=1968906 RepID=UPI00184D6BFD|nr:hypothetical protein [Rhodoplanes sp.]NVO15679.1 hypothetical protein [Rhodoplanes sp.]
MSTDGDGPAAELPGAEALAELHGDNVAPPAFSVGRSRWRTEKSRQDAIHHDSRHACVESKTLIDGAAERVLSSGKACVIHNEQVAKSRITIAQSRALMKRLDRE